MFDNLFGRTGDIDGFIADIKLLAEMKKKADQYDQLVEMLKSIEQKVEEDKSGFFPRIKKVTWTMSDDVLISLRGEFLKADIEIKWEE